MKTIVLRFRDLSIPTGQTIRRHREKIRTQGSTWWGWVARQRECFPEVLLLTLVREAAAESGKVIYLYHSGECQFYPATVSDISAYPGGAGILTPEVHKTPSYMSEAECPAWFKLTSIGDPSPRLSKPAIFSMPTISEFTQVDKELMDAALQDGERLRHSSATLWAIEMNGSG